MSKPKVLIMVHGGVAEYLCIGDIDVVLVDEDNIDAGDPRVELDPEWGPHMEGVYDLPHSKYVYIGQGDEAIKGVRLNQRGQAQSKGPGSN